MVAMVATVASIQDTRDTSPFVGNACIQVQGVATAATGATALFLLLFYGYRLATIGYGIM